jgi:hypothetical protein
MRIERVARRSPAPLAGDSSLQIPLIPWVKRLVAIKEGGLRVATKAWMMYSHRRLDGCHRHRSGLSVQFLEVYPRDAA